MTWSALGGFIPLAGLILFLVWKDKPSDASKGRAAGLGALGGCIPLVGLVLFLMWKDSKPLDAKAAGIGAIASVAFYALLFLF